METNYVLVGCIAALIALSAVVAGFFVVEHSNVAYIPVSSQKIIQLAPQHDKIKVSYQKDSNATIGVLIRTNDLDAVSSLINSKRGTSNKNKIGKVISASIPQNEISSVSQDQSVIEVLPNRPVQAFAVDVSSLSPQTFWNQGVNGDVIVAVLDTGVNSKTIASADFTGSGTTTDENGHGTAIADVLASVAPGVKIINAKVLDKNGFGSEATVIAGINYAVEHNAQVISLSLGGLFSDINSPLVAAVEDAVSKGVTVVVAAGNCGPVNNCNGFTGVTTPGNAPDAITVGAVDGDTALSYSSGQNFGSYIKPDVVAPGVNIDHLSGTSIATPFVSGAAALLIEKYKVQPSQVKALLEENAIDLGIRGKDTQFGSGRLNLAFATEALPEAQAVVPTTTTFSSLPRAIQAMGLTNPLSHAGEWQIIKSMLPGSAQYLGNLKTLKSEFYNKTFGFVYLGLYAYKVTGINSSLETYPFNEEHGYYYVINDLKVVDPSRIYIVSLDRVKKFANNSWVNETLPTHAHTTNNGLITGGFDLKTIDFNRTIAQTTLFAGGSNLTGQGVILKKVNAGTWGVEPGSFAPIKDIEFVNATQAIALAVKRSGKTPDQGFYVWNKNVGWSSYNNITSPIRGELNEIAVVSNTNAWAVGNNGTIMQWNGATWSDAVSQTKQALYGVSFKGSSLGYAVGDNTTILKYTGSWAVNSAGEALISPDACYPINGTCTPVTYANMTLTDVNLLSPTTGYIVGRSGAYILHSVQFQLVPNAPVLNVPKLDVVQSQSLVINLNSYSDGDSFTLDPADTAKCSLAGNQLTVLASSTIGIESCKVTAIKGSLTTTEAVAIEVHPSGPVADLVIDSTDIQVVNANDPLETINVTVHNIGQSAASSFGVKLVETNKNNFVQEATQTISVPSGTINTISFNLNINRGSVLTAIADYNNNIVEASEANNRAQITYKKVDVYLNMSIEASFAAPIAEYLQLTQYNVVNSLANAEAIINIAYNAGTKQKGCSLGTVYFGGKAVTDVHTGLIFSTQSNGKPVVNVCGARIEGLVNALRRMDKEDLSKNKEAFFDRDDLGAIATRDYFAGKVLNAELVRQALQGGLSSDESFIQTFDGLTFLRLKHYKPVLTQSFLDYLFSIDPVKYNGPPVVMAGGLWSDINAWDQAGKEIAIGMDDRGGELFDTIKYVPRDVWLVELTGGPNTECATCADYTYGDVYGKFWPALVGGVLKLTGKSQVDYVGHSNGGRAALDALKNYTTGKVNAGKLADGTVFNLPSNSVKTFIGVGVPGAFNGYSPFASILAKKLNQIDNNVQARGLTHLIFADISSEILFGLQPPDGDSKISFNLWKKYADLMNLTTDVQPGTGVTLDKTLMMGGTLFGTHDEIVPINDVDSVYSNIGVNVGGKKVLVHMFDGHIGMTEQQDVKRSVKEFLNGDPLTGKIENQVNG